MSGPAPVLGTASPVVVAPRSRARQVTADYFDLTKPKVQTLLLFTTVTAMEIAGNPVRSKIALTCLGGYLSAGGAGAVNHYYDRDIDAQMGRTAARPIPSGRICPRAALDLRLRAGALSFALLSLTVNVLAASLALGGFVGYVGVYTMWLKRRTPQNIVIGGAAGAMPPLVGWAATARLAVLDRGLPVRDRLLLDAAALLGPQPADEGRVRQGRRADDAGRPRRARDAPPDPALHAAALRGHAAAVLRRRLRRDLPRRLDGPGLGVHRRRRALYRRADRRAALRLYLFSLLYLALLFGAMVADAKL